MGIHQSKLKCLYLPAQSGKTRKVEDLIIHYKNIHECFGDGDVNIVISANNILLVKQTEARMKKDLATDSEEGANDAVIKSGVFSWTSGEKECNISARELKDRIQDDEVEMVVLCAHPKRLKYLAEMLQLLGTSRFFTKKINIWIDEADKSIKLWAKHAAVLSLPTIHQVTLVSATFATVVAKYGQLQVMPFEVTHPACYRRLKDAKRFEENFATADAAEFVKHVILKNREKLVRPGMRAFIPGEMRKASHDAIADFLYSIGFIVIVINGERKEILVPGEPKIDLRCYLTVSNGETPEEFNVQLAKLYTENNWKRFPLAITGFYCVERGVTFQCGPEPGVHDGFLFDYGVIPPIACKSEAYQAMARLFGNIGHLPTYKPVEIYTTSAMFNKVEKQEEMAVNLSRMVYEQELAMVGKKEFKAAQNFDAEAEWTLHEAEFLTLKTANEFMHRYGAQGKTQKALDGDMEGSFYKSATTSKATVLSYDIAKREMSAWSKLAALDVKGKKGNAYGRMRVLYKDIADPTSRVFHCRLVTRNV
jgi:hypothetical protein